MAEENVRPLPRHKAEQDAERNPDSMMPVCNDPSKDKMPEALPKSRKQRRMEQKNLTSGLFTEEPSARNTELKTKAKEFSRMIFTDPSLDQEAFSSMSVSPDDTSEKKKSRKAKVDDFYEGIDIPALNSRVDNLLGKFLRRE